MPVTESSAHTVGSSRNFARKLQQVSRAFESGFPQDVLRTDAVHPRFIQHIGLPEDADAVAYEPVQRLLAVRRFVCLVLGDVFGWDFM